MFDWNKFLKNDTNRSSQASSREGTLICLAQYKLLIVSGPDASSFLQGQCSCDFERLERMQFVLGAHCNHKGRMHSSFYAAKLADGSIALKVHQSIAEYALNELKKYIVFSKAEITIGETYATLGLLGDHAEHLVSELGFSDVEDTPVGGVRHLEQNTLLKYQKQQMELWLDEEALQAIWPKLIERYSLGHPQSWDYTNIQQGWGEIREQTKGLLIPQELNFQLVDGISFDKGCYTGQEIIARLHYRGQLKKHMYRGMVTSQSAPQAGDEIYGAKPDKPIGMIIIASPVAEQDDQSVYEFLALADDKAVKEDIAHLNNKAATKVQWLSLPYAIH